MISYMGYDIYDIIYGILSLIYDIYVYIYDIIYISYIYIAMVSLSTHSHSLRLSHIDSYGNYGLA